VRRPARVSCERFQKPTVPSLLPTGKNDVALQEAKDVIARIVKQRGFKLLGIRLLPTDNTALGASALATEPHVLQMFVENTKNFNDRDFDRCVPVC